MILRKSRFVHLLPLGMNRVLLVHAISHLRLAIDQEVSDAIDYFTVPRTMPDDYDGLARLIPYEQKTILGLIGTLMERGILTEMDAAGEMDDVAAKLGATHGRDPGELLEQFRREQKEGAHSYWSADSVRTVSGLGSRRKRVDVLLLGDCDVHMEADFLRRDAARRGIDLRVAATSPDDFRLAGEHRHDAIILGAVQARHAIATAPSGQKPPHDDFIAHVGHVLRRLRRQSAAPILIDNLPEPTVQPLGLAERGAGGHRNRFRAANLALADLAEEFSDVHVVDIAAALAAAGSARLLDDGQTAFTHFGSPGWMLQRPQSEKAAVHGIFPDTAPLAALVGGDPYGREAVAARAHVDALAVVLGLDRKKCVILDLDGVLWPGVLAETGAPFAWHPEISGTSSYVGLFFGLHEALLSLKRRGIVLACVSKNDEATVRELWRYPAHYPRQRLLTPDDFVTWRINWQDKSENIRSIADELGFALETFLFIDDHPVERDRVRQRLPEVETWGEDAFALRRLLLEDPRLQVPRVTAEAAQRSDLVKSQLSREKSRAEAVGEAEYLASLQIRSRITRLTAEENFERIEELFQRTTQFNATGRKFPVAELRALLADPDAAIFTLHVSDRFGDQGLVGVAIVESREIIGLVMSCRVLGIGVENEFLQQVAAGYEELAGRIVETARNARVRNIYRDNGFTAEGAGRWRLRRGAEIERRIA